MAERYSRVVGIDPSVGGRIGMAAVSFPAARPLFLGSYPLMERARAAFAEAAVDGSLVVIEEPLVVTSGAPRSPATVVALLLRAGQFAELAEQRGLVWRLVKVATWKAARSIPPNTKTDEAKRRSVALANAALDGFGVQADADSADALNLAIVAAGFARFGRL